VAQKPVADWRSRTIRSGLAPRPCSEEDFLSTSAAALSADEQFMNIAVEIARRGAAAGEPPVGACLVRGGEVVVRAHNAIIAQLDITAHAEIMVLREACQSLRVLRLDKCVLYATVEPCPMCLAAAFYAGVTRVVYGVEIDAMHELTGAELKLQTQDFQESMQDLSLCGGVLRAECLQLLKEWQSVGRRAAR